MMLEKIGTLERIVATRQVIEQNAALTDSMFALDDFVHRLAARRL